MALKIAVVGAYGSGKTTFTEVLSRVTGLPRTHGTPAQRAAVPVSDWSAADLLRFMVQRYTERLSNESSLPDGFVSDGSVLHEWVYTKVRLVCGSYPRTGTALEWRPRPADVRCFEEAADGIAALLREHARTGYDAVVHLPIEFELAEDNRPINEHFRRVGDELLLSALGELGVTVHTVSGDLTERVRKTVSTLGLDVSVPVEDAVSASGSTKGN